MNVKEQLSLLIGQLNQLDAPYPPEKLDELIAAVGSFPPIAIREDLLKSYRAKREVIERTDIPCVLAEYGLKSAEMDDGTNVGLATFYETRQGDKNLFAEWLIAHGYGDIIKDTLAFGKGEVDEDLLAYLSERAYSFSRDSSINSQTAKKVIKDHLAGGGDLPPREAVEVTIFECAVIKRPKGGF